jgi:membrane protein DedA with SNARE-associated domain
MEALAERVAAALWAGPPAVFYFGLAGSALVETIFPPYPGDTVTVVGGAMAGGGKLTAFLVWLSSVAGCFAGTMMLYFVGRGSGHRLLRRHVARLGPGSELSRVEAWFTRWGKLVVLGSRFLPAVRSLIAVGAGTTGMKIVPMAVLSLVGIAVWHGLLVGGGVVLGTNWQRLALVLARYSQILLGTLLLVVVAAVLAKVVRRRG